ncbi:MAG: alanine racemase [Acidimicrobiales bacterium]
MNRSIAGCDAPLASSLDREFEASRKLVASSDSTDLKELRERLERIRERIRAAGGDPAVVKVVGVTKGFPVSVARSALEAGICDLGENYAAELTEKAKVLREEGSRPDSRQVCERVRWHFLGALQRRKVRLLAPHVALWQSLAREVEGEELSRWAPGAEVLVQVNASRGGDRRGVAPGRVPLVVDHLRALGLEVRGLMAVGTQGDAGEVREQFRSLAAVGADLGLVELSMGMTDDLEVAVQEGATMVRIGRGLFGKRTLARVAAQ